MPYEYPEESGEQPSPGAPNELAVDGYYYTTDDSGHVVYQGRTTDPMEHGCSVSFSLLNLPDDDPNCFDGSDAIYVDYLFLERHVAVHAVIDTDSNSNVQDFAYEVVGLKDAVATFEGIVDSAYEWFSENWPVFFREDKIEESGVIDTQTKIYDSVMFRLHDTDTEEDAP